MGRPELPGASGFAALLRYYRHMVGLTQEDLATHAGLSARTVSDLERGVKGRPHLDTVHRLAAALGLEGPARRAFEGARGRSTSEATANLWVDSQHQRDPLAAPLVGRAREVALLTRHLCEAGPPALLLAGEPGIGKSRLLHEAGQQAGAHGWRVLAGGCQRRHGQAPFAPLLEALERYVARRASGDLRADLRGCAWLVRLLPELAGGPIEPLPGWTLPPEQERRLMDRAVIHFLENVAGPAGTLLVLDDLHWADADALTLLATLVRAATERPVRLIGAYRDTEVPADHPLAGVLADLAHAGLARQHTLGRLAETDARQLLATLFDCPPGDCETVSVRERVVQRAGGVPFYLVSYAQGLRGDAWEGAVETVPWDVAQGIRQRLAALPVPAQEVLGAAAVIGRVVPVHLLLAVADHGEREVLTALARARHAGLLLEEEQGYQFAHDLIYEVIEAEMGAAWRMVLHRRVAETLEQSPGQPAVELLADHYHRAGVVDKALLYWERAGEKAQAEYANATAVATYGALAARLDTLGQGGDAARVREKLARVLYTTAASGAALAALEQASETYQAAADLESLARVTAQIGLVHQSTGRFAEAVARLAHLGERLEAHGPSAGIIRLYVALSDLQACGCGRYRDGLATAQRAVSLARTLGDVPLLAEALAAEGAALLALGQLVDAERALEEAVPLAEAGGDLVESLPKALWLLSIVHLRYGQLAASRHACEQELAVTTRTGHVIRMEAATALHGLIAYVGGDWTQARRDGEHALALDLQVGTNWTSAVPPLVVGLVCSGEGQWEDAARYLEASMVLEGARVGYHPYVDYAPSVLAEHEVRAGQPERALARLTPVVNRLEHAAGDVSLGLPPFAWAQLELGEVAAASAIVGQAITDARARQDRLALVDALRVQALVALRQDRRIEARQVLEEGLTLARSMPYPYAEARYLQVYAQLHLQGGEREAARERLEEALAIVRLLGARRDVEQAEQALTSLSAD